MGRTPKAKKAEAPDGAATLKDQVLDIRKIVIDLREKLVQQSEKISQADSKDEVIENLEQKVEKLEARVKVLITYISSFDIFLNNGQVAGQLPDGLAERSLTEILSGLP